MLRGGFRKEENGCFMNLESKTDVLSIAILFSNSEVRIHRSINFFQHKFFSAHCGTYVAVKCQKNGIIGVVSVDTLILLMFYK